MLMFDLINELKTLRIISTKNGIKFSSCYVVGERDDGMTSSLDQPVDDNILEILWWESYSLIKLDLKLRRARVSVFQPVIGSRE